ncbi:MAG: cobalamin biosynthesis protein CobD/CbiB [Cognaticolwellia sp.]
MDIDTLVIVVGAGLIGLNYLAFAGRGWHRRLWLFWTVQALNLLAACYMVVWGVPGFREQAPIVNYFLAAMFVVRSLLNGRRLQSSYRDAIEEDEEEKDQLRESIMEKLKGSDEKGSQG